MKIINAQQGSDEWNEIRGKYRTASEASAMMGASKKTSRNELIRMKATGDKKEFSAWVKENLLDNGHEIEAKARPIAEEIIGEELYPITAVCDNDYLLASYDGSTMLNDIGWECKSWNEEKAAIVREGKVPDEDYWQVAQQLVVGVEKVLYMVTDGTPEKTVYVWKTLEGDDEKRLLDGWRQFDEDVENYVHVENPEAPVATPVKDLPAVYVQVSGAIEISDNFKVFEAALRDFIDNRLIRKPKTDQDFADLDLQIKALKKAEDLLISEERRVLSQMEAIDQFKRTKDMLHNLARDNRLIAEKLLKAEKEARRSEILQGGKDALEAHIEKIDATFNGRVCLPKYVADFAGSMKNKRTISTLQDAVDTVLAQAKIETNNMADEIRVNLATLDKLAADYQFLFSDLQNIATKPGDDFAALVKLRIAEHKEAQAKRLEAEREKIRAEEEAKIRAEEEDRQRVINNQRAIEATQALAEAGKAEAIAHHNRQQQSSQIGENCSPQMGHAVSHHKTPQERISEYLFNNAKVSASTADRIATMIVMGKVPGVAVVSRKSA